MKPLLLLAIALAAAAKSPMTTADGWAWRTVADPQISPDGRKLAWIAWQCPNMPWDATVLWVADIEPLGDPEGAQCRLVRPCPVASGRHESLVQPEWGPDGELYVESQALGALLQTHVEA